MEKTHREYIAHLSLEELYYRRNMTYILLDSPIIIHPEEQRTEEEIRNDFYEHIDHINARIDELESEDWDNIKNTDNTDNTKDT